MNTVACGAQNDGHSTRHISQWWAFVSAMAVSVSVGIDVHAAYWSISSEKVTTSLIWSLPLQSTPLPPSITFCHPPNLWKFLDPQLPRPSPGSYPCLRPHHKTCSIHPSSLSFTSPVTNLSYPIHTHATCFSSNLIYLPTCTQCDVGETKNNLSTRMFGYISTPDSLPFLS